jgi:hypothetical protein
LGGPVSIGNIAYVSRILEVVQQLGGIHA